MSSQAELDAQQGTGPRGAILVNDVYATLTLAGITLSKAILVHTMHIREDRQSFSQPGMSSRNTPLRLLHLSGVFFVLHNYRIVDLLR